jgi:hypothetical protein
MPQRQKHHIMYDTSGMDRTLRCGLTALLLLSMPMATIRGAEAYHTRAFTTPLLLLLKMTLGEEEAQMNTMPAAFRITGAACAQYNGIYSRMATATINDKPVYKLGGAYGKFLFQPTSRTTWMATDDQEVGTGDHITDCEGRPWWIESDHNKCAASPDGGGCVGTWRESTSDCGEDRTWCPSPGLSVSDLACDRVNCDERHRCESTVCEVAGACARCVCKSGWSSEHCETQVSYCDGDGGVSHVCVHTATTAIRPAAPTV